MSVCTRLLVCAQLAGFEDTSLVRPTNDARWRYPMELCTWRAWLWLRSCSDCGYTFSAPFFARVCGGCVHNSGCAPAGRGEEIPCLTGHVCHSYRLGSASGVLVSARGCILLRDSTELSASPPPNPTKYKSSLAEVARNTIQRRRWCVPRGSSA